MSEKLFIIGAGGHCIVVLDACLHSFTTENINVYAQQTNEKIKQIFNITVHEYKEIAELQLGTTHLAIGNNNTRSSLKAMLAKQSVLLATIMHPKSLVSQYALIKPGCFIAQGAIIAPAVTIGSCSIINHGAIIDHECEIGECCHIAPNVTLGGQVKIGKECLIGSGACVLPGVVIGDNAIIGSGAVVTKNVASGKVILGVPAKEKI